MKSGSNQYLNNNALQLADSKYGTVGSITDVAFPTNFTFTCWYKLNDAFNTYPQFITSIQSGTTNYFGVAFRDVGSLTTLNLDLYMYTSSAQFNGLLNQAVIPKIYNQINCLVITVSDTAGTTTIRYYLNNNLLVNQTQSTARPSVFKTVRVGFDGGSYFHGKIGEMRLISSAIDAGQINKFYNNGRGSNNLDSLTHLLWYKFNESSGTTVVDSSGNGRTLTLTGSPTFGNFFIIKVLYIIINFYNRELTISISIHPIFFNNMCSFIQHI